MSRLILILSLLAFVLAVRPVGAVTNWHFAGVMSAAQATHPIVTGKLAGQAAAQAEREGANWQRYPTPSVEASTGSGDKSTVFRLDQPVWTGGRISAGIDAAGRRFDAAGSAVVEARRELALRVVAASSEALRHQARQAHTQAGVDAHRKLLDMIRRRVVQEVSPQADEKLAQSRLFTAANDHSATTQALQNALAQLGQLAGEPVSRFDPAGYDEAASASGVPTGLDLLLEQALATSPVLQRLKHEEEAASADVTSKRSAYYPQVTVRLQSTQGDVSDNAAYLVLSAQPGAGLSAGAGVQAALARLDAARLATTAAERDIRERLTLDWNEWMAARARLENAEQARATSVEVSESYARQYTAGRKSWLDVMNAVREATQSELAAVDARAQMQAAILRIKVQTGAMALR